MNKRVQAVYSGRVQGVGFRFTAERFARDFSIAGSVKNLPDGKVKIVAEGQEKDLRSFLARINEYFERNINDIDLSWQEPTSEFSGFEVTF